ncbi:MAG: hypothetical protein FWF73_05730 [Spirochaetes bacterium]|nr:hypothetical protein [Spirochaetota bacterium]
MNTFLKRNRMIKLFTAGWIFAMAVIAVVFLLGAPQDEYINVAEQFYVNVDKNVYEYVWYDMNGKAQRVVYCSINISFVNDDSNCSQTGNDYHNYICQACGVTFTPIDTYDTKYTVIIAEELRESTEESTIGDTYAEGFWL